jgi:hypothetical protein
MSGANGKLKAGLTGKPTPTLPNTSRFSAAQPQKKPAPKPVPKAEDKPAPAPPVNPRGEEREPESRDVQPETVPEAASEVDEAEDSLPELLTKPDLIGIIRRDIAALGMVGESDNAVLTYLIFTSRVLKEPASIIRRGKTGHGKSVLLRKVALLFPAEVKIQAMKMTDAAWFNTPPEFFKHKVFFGGERTHARDEATRDAGALLRQLLSEKRIDRGVCIFDEKAKKW